MAVVAIPVMAAVGMVFHPQFPQFLGVIGINLLTSAGQMTATFNTIGANLTKSRVAQ